MALWFLLQFLRLYVVGRWQEWQAWKEKRRKRDEKRGPFLTESNGRPSTE
jgi:hypothetical protein